MEKPRAELMQLRRMHTTKWPDLEAEVKNWITDNRKKD
jgi:hypothetical protein